jgi:hypothetical protein
METNFVFDDLWPSVIEKHSIKALIAKNIAAERVQTAINKARADQALSIANYELVKPEMDRMDACVAAGKCKADKGTMLRRSIDSIKALWDSVAPQKYFPDTKRMQLLEKIAKNFWGKVNGEKPAPVQKRKATTSDVDSETLKIRISKNFNSWSPVAIKNGESDKFARLQALVAELKEGDDTTEINELYAYFIQKYPPTVAPPKAAKKSTKCCGESCTKPGPYDGYCHECVLDGPIDERMRNIRQREQHFFQIATKAQIKEYAPKFIEEMDGVRIKTTSAIYDKLQDIYVKFHNAPNVKHYGKLVKLFADAEAFLPQLPIKKVDKSGKVKFMSPPSSRDASSDDEDEDSSDEEDESESSYSAEAKKKKSKKHKTDVDDIHSFVYAALEVANDPADRKRLIMLANDPNTPHDLLRDAAEKIRLANTITYKTYICEDGIDLRLQPLEKTNQFTDRDDAVAYGEYYTKTLFDAKRPPISYRIEEIHPTK